VKEWAEEVIKKIGSCQIQNLRGKMPEGIDKKYVEEIKNLSKRR